MPHSHIDHFESARRRIARAQTHIGDLGGRIKAYMTSEPYGLVIEPSGDGIHEIHKLKAKEPFPGIFSDIATDAIFNLRSSLDHAAYTIAVKSGVTDSKALKHIYFPFASNDKALAGVIQSVCKGIRPELIALMTSFRPYQGGDDTLWAIHELANLSKHRSLATVVFNIQGFDTEHMDGFTEVYRPPVWDRANNEIVLGMAPLKAHVKCKARLEYLVGIEDVQAVAAQPITALLNAMTGIVERIILGLEAEGRRIGVFSFFAFFIAIR